MRVLIFVALAVVVLACSFAGQAEARPSLDESTRLHRRSPNNLIAAELKQLRKGRVPVETLKVKRDAPFLHPETPEQALLLGRVGREVRPAFVDAMLSMKV
ncbi:uncharacterized protein LOC117644157 [Thrips palmi]|uniref:Uncharacterized protein LOC117644157 n=1 Tax=Thrips palmi TaxID=161013 RepID=A0A6P8YYH5_THRPL|nr:uncharacterized protein LOC117644157 [Thrips palmi]